MFLIAVGALADDGGRLTVARGLTCQGHRFLGSGPFLVPAVARRGPGHSLGGGGWGARTARKLGCKSMYENGVECARGSAMVMIWQGWSNNSNCHGAGLVEITMTAGGNNSLLRVCRGIIIIIITEFWRPPGSVHGQLWPRKRRRGSSFLSSSAQDDQQEGM